MNASLGFASVLFTEIAQSDRWVGGRTDASYVMPQGRFLVRVTIGRPLGISRSSPSVMSNV